MIDNNSDSLQNNKINVSNNSLDNVNNPIISQLIELGYNPLYSKRIFFYNHPSSVEDALDYFAFQNGIIQHHFVQDRNSPNSNICYVCGELENIHLNFNQINNNNNNIHQNNEENLLDKSNDTKPKKESIVKQECEICSVHFTPNDNNKLKNCGHAFCDDCWYNFLSIKIKENRINTIKCLDFDCQEKPDDYFVVNLLKNDSALIQKFKKFKLELEIINDPNKKLCPFPNCDSFLELKNPEIKYVKCLNNHNYCFFCLNNPHGQLPCDMKINNALDEYSKTNFIKKCPKCGIITEKIEGCNHIICSKCNYQWCWLCNNEYTEGHYTHGKCKGFQFFRPKDENEIQLAMEGKIELRESQRQDDDEDSIVFEYNNNDDDYVEVDLHNYSHNFRNPLNNSITFHNEIQIRENKSLNFDFIKEDNENNKNQRNLLEDNKEKSEIEIESESEVEFIEVKNRNYDLEIIIKDKNSKTNENENKDKNNIDNNLEKNKEQNNIINNNEINLDNNIDNNIIKKENEKSIIKDDVINIENKDINNNNIDKLSIISKENININNNLNNNKEKENNNYNIEINNNKNEKDKDNNIIIYNINNILRKDSQNNSNNSEENNNSISNIDYNINQKNKIIIDNGERGINSKEDFIPENRVQKTNRNLNNDINNNENSNNIYSFNLLQKILLLFIYILFGHFFIPSNIFLQKFKHKFIVISFLIFEIPYFFIQIFINISMIFIYFSRVNTNAFFYQFYNNIKINFNEKYKFHDITIFIYYVLFILFFGTFLKVISFLINKIETNKIIIYISGVTISLLIFPLHIIINPILLFFIAHISKYNSEKILKNIKKFVYFFKNKNS